MNGNLVLHLTSSCSSHGPTCRRQHSCHPSPSPVPLPLRSPCLLRLRPCPPFVHPHLVFSDQIPVIYKIYFGQSFFVVYYRFSCVRGFLLLPVSACSCFGLVQKRSSEYNNKTIPSVQFKNFTLSASIFFPVFLLFNVLKLFRVFILSQITSDPYLHD